MPTILEPRTTNAARHERTDRALRNQRRRQSLGASAAPAGAPPSLARAGDHPALAAWRLLMGRATYPLVKRVLDTLLAGTLLALCLPIALVALAPLRQRALPRLAATACAGRAGRPFTRRREILRSGDSAATRWLARSALPDWPVLLSVLAGHVSFVGPRILDTREAAGRTER
jgi:lipopolysaccharide/colanic/teichoic acid biosynthesis glycosyltransferase